MSLNPVFSSRMGSLHGDACPGTRLARTQGRDRATDRPENEREGGVVIPLILWLLGVPLSLIIILWLIGVV